MLGKTGMIQNKIIGLTGGIASGKSTVSKYLISLGIPVVDADLVSREVVEPGQPGLREIKAAFGHEVISDGQLDRRALRDIIFSDVSKRELLNSILHPIIHDAIESKINQLKASHSIIVFDAPLLLENNLKYMVDSLWLVTCTVEKQIERVMVRDRISREDALRIINSQMALSDKEDMADIILNNNTSVGQLYDQVDLQLSILKGK